MDDAIDRDTDPGIGAAVDAQLALVDALAGEAAAEVERLRHVQIPQHVGMAAAARALAADLPRLLAAQLQEELTTGALGARWEAALAKAAGAEGPPSPAAALLAVANVLIEQSRATARFVAGRAEEWAAGAHRLEGHANGLEAQAARLARARDDIARSQAAGEAQHARQEARRAARVEDAAAPAEVPTGTEGR